MRKIVYVNSRSQHPQDRIDITDLVLLLVTEALKYEE